MSGEKPLDTISFGPFGSFSWSKMIGRPKYKPKTKEGEIAPGIPDPLYVMIDMIISKIQRFPDSVSKEYKGSDGPDITYFTTAYLVGFPDDLDISVSFDAKTQYTALGDTRDVFFTNVEVKVGDQSFHESWMARRIMPSLSESLKLQTKLKSNEAMARERERACKAIEHICGIDRNEEDECCGQVHDLNSTCNCDCDNCLR